MPLVTMSNVNKKRVTDHTEYWRYELDWADCGTCGSEDVIALRENGAVENTPLTVKCEDCGSVIKHTPILWVRETQVF